MHHDAIDILLAEVLENPMSICRLPETHRPTPSWWLGSNQYDDLRRHDRRL